MVLADQVAVEHEKTLPEKFFMDSGGLGGPVFDRLQQLGVPVVGIDSGSNAAEEDKYFDKRTEMWWHMAEWLRRGGCVPFDAKLRRDLIAPNLGYKKVNKRTKIKLESKDELLKRGIPSPDHGDALALTFASPVHGSRNADLDPMDQLMEALKLGRGSGKIIGGTEDSYDPLGGF